MSELDLSKYTIKPSALTQPELVVFYGPAGGGKSYLSASASEVEGLYPVLIVDTEGSTAGTVAAFDDDRIDILPVSDHATFEQITEALLTRPHKYKTVVIDTFDVAQERAVEAYQDENSGDGFAAWREVKSWTNRKARDFKSAPFLGILVFHQTEEKTESGLVTGRKLSLQGSAKETMPGIPDVVGWVTRKADKDGHEVSTVKFAPDPKLATKNRFGLPDKMEDVRMSDIYEWINNRSKRNKKEEEK